MSPELDTIQNLLAMLSLSPPKFTQSLSDSTPIISQICFNISKLAFPVLYPMLLPTALVALCNTGRTSHSVAATGKKKWREGKSVSYLSR